MRRGANAGSSQDSGNYKNFRNKTCCESMRGGMGWKFSSQETFGICPLFACCLEQFFHILYKHIFLNKQGSLVLRLNLFDAVVSPAMLFGLAALPLTKVGLPKLGVVHTRMLRSVLGCVRIHEDQSWRDIMVQMNHKLTIANILFPRQDWEDRLFRSKFRGAHWIAGSPEAWPANFVSWNPLMDWESDSSCKPQGKRGCPSTRWDDSSANFSREFLHKCCKQRGSPLKDFMYRSAEPTLVCNHVGNRF